MLGEPQPSLLDSLAGALRDPHPLSFLESASGLAQVTAPDPLASLRRGAAAERPSMERDELTEAFLEVGHRETDALLLVWAAMLDRPDLALRVREAKRRHSLPHWLQQLDQVRVVRAIENTHILGDGDNLFLGVETPGRSFTIVVYIDHNMGTIVKDCYFADVPIREALARLDALRDDDTDLHEILLEDAAAKLTQAVEQGDRMLEPFTTDSWPQAKPLLEWMLRGMPAGGESYAWTELSDREWTKLQTDFAGSEFGRPLSAEQRDQADTLMQFAANYGTGDPLRWSNVVVEIMLLDLIPRKVVAPRDYLITMPETLRSVIRYAHEQRSIPAVYTDQALAAIDEFLPHYLDAISQSRGQGPAALLERMGVLDPLDGSELDDVDPTDYLGVLARSVGGTDVLDALDSAPLPDEPLDVASLPADVVDRVRAVSTLADSACTDLFADPELRTAARRALARIAMTDPAIFRRRSSDATAAAALCWIVAKGNDYLGFGDDVSVAELMAHFGLKGSPGQRAQPMLRALGLPEYDWTYDPDLGSADLLTSGERAEIIRQRDRWREAFGQS